LENLRCNKCYVCISELLIPSYNTHTKYDTYLHIRLPIPNTILSSN